MNVDTNLSDIDEMNDISNENNCDGQVIDKKSAPSTPPSKLKVAFFWMCGIESSLKQNKDRNKIKVSNNVDVSIDQDPFWARVCDLNAIFAIALMSSGFAFLNKYN